MLSPDLLTTARRRQNQFLLLLGGAYAVGLVAVFVIVLAFEDRHSGGHTSPGLVLLVVGVPLLIIAAMLTGMVVARNRGVRWLQPSPLLGADRGTRKRVRKALKSGHHLEVPDEEELATITAERILKQPKVHYWITGIFAVSAVLQLVAGNYWATGLTAVAVVYYPAVFGLVRRRASRYLATTGPTSTPAPAPPA